MRFNRCYDSFVISNGNRMNIVYGKSENATNMRVRGCELMDTCYASRLGGEQTRTEWNSASVSVFTG